MNYYYSLGKIISACFQLAYFFSCATRLIIDFCPLRDLLNRLEQHLPRKKNNFVPPAFAQTRR